MKMCGTFLQLGAILALLLGMVDGVLSYGSSGAGSGGFLIIVGSLLAALLLYGTGGAFIALDGMALDARRTAEALEVLVEELTPINQSTPETNTATPSPSKTSNADRLLRRIRPDDKPPTP